MAHVCGVIKFVIIVRRVVGEGGTVVFKKGYGWITDGNTGERIWMTEKEGMYMVKLWVQKKSFQRQ